MAPPAKRRKCTGKFQKEWVAMFGGMIVQSKAGEQYARCSVCSRDVKVAASGLYQGDFANEVTRAEVMFAYLSSVNVG